MQRASEILNTRWGPTGNKGGMFQPCPASQDLTAPALGAFFIIHEAIALFAGLRPKFLRKPEFVRIAFRASFKLLRRQHA